MALQLTCPQCRSTVSAPDDAAGCAVRCSGCMAVITVPSRPTAEPCRPAEPPGPPLHFTAPRPCPAEAARPAQLNISSRPLTVSGFPARELICEIPGQEHTTTCMVVAESRFYAVIAAGRGSGADPDRTARFLNSFEVIDPNLMPREKRQQK